MDRKNILIILADEKPEVFANDPDNKKSLAKLEEAGGVISFYEDHIFSKFENPLEYVTKMEHEGPEWWDNEPGLLEAVKGKEILIVQASGINSQLMDADPELEVVAYIRSGLEMVNLEYCREKGIKVFNCPGRHANSVADLTMALILSENKGIQRLNIKSNNGKFIMPKTSDDPGSKPLCMQTAGLIGYGIIAQAVAKRLIACGTTVCAWDPFVPQEKFDELGVKKFENMNDMIPECDIVSMHLRLTPETQGMFGREQFGLMKPSAIFVNTARAGMVDEQALIDFLKEGKIRGAGLDVYSYEPLEPDHPFVTMPNVTATPHIGGQYYGVNQWSFSITAEIVANYLKG